MKRLSGKSQEIAQLLYEEQIALNAETVSVEEVVKDIVADVAQNGDEALIRYNQQFDGIYVEQLAVSDEMIDEAFAAIDPQILSALQKAKANIESYHLQQVEKGFEDQPSTGVIRGQLIRPLERVGVYVPGGTAAYPSSVLMNVVPAKIAGVSEIVMITPPQETYHPAILVAAKLAGVDKIYQVGGAHGIAALAYGTESIPKVDKITGPGNIYVATAKKLVYGLVGIDMIAGPSEIGVIADETANPVYVAADLLSQAEHDKLARAILVTNSAKLAQQVEQEIEPQLESLPRKEIAAASIADNGRIILTETVDEMFELMNLVAPEHLETAMENAYEYLPFVKHAGSIFLGHFTSEPIGDYFAGTNHVLPTSGTSRIYSALGDHDFIKRFQYTQYSKEAVQAASQAITTLAYSEGLAAHARATEVRNDES